MDSLLTFVAKYAAHGNEIAVRRRRGYRMQSFTYGEIAANAHRMAHKLASRGIGKGDAVLLWGENSAEWIASFLGCVLCGAIIVPVDHASTPDFAGRVAREVNAKLSLIGRAQKPSELGIPSWQLESLSELLTRHAASPFPSPNLSPKDPLQIIFTSGTTAEPRGVVISHANVLANIAPLEREIQKYLRYEKWVHPLRFLNLLPLSHVFGQMLAIFIPPLLGATVVFLDSLKPAEMGDAIRRERISVLVAVPRFIESLQREVERREERDGKLAQLRRNFAAAEKEHFLRRWWRFRRVHRRLGWKFWALISGGAALPAQAETFWRRLGYAVIQGYGMTETTSLISLNHPFRAESGSIGKVFPGMEVRVDENGEILVRGENVATTYRQAGQSVSLADADGWFRTGDLAEKDAAGNLYFKGRKKNVIVTSAGMNVYPEDLEKALRAQPGIKDCVVLGVTHNNGDEPHAVLLLRGEYPHAAEAVEHANHSLAEYQKIRHWTIWPDADFPRTPTQKPILPLIRQTVQNAQPSSTAAAPAQGSVANLLSQITGRPLPENAAETNLDSDLQLSSLDRVELMGALEERHQLDLNEVEFQNVATVRQLERLIGEGAPLTATHAYPTWPQHPLVNAFRLAVYYLLSWPATYLLAAPRIRGRENLRDLRGPVLVIANHVTDIDIAWVLAALPARFRNRLATAMGGERLSSMRRPSATAIFFERFMERLRYVLVTTLFNVFPLPKKSGFLRSFGFAGSLADRGWSILVFPEGQTTTDGNLLPFRAGIGLLAKHLNIPVVPVHLAGLFDLKQRKKIIAPPGHIHATIGEPVRFTPDQDAAEIARDLESRIRQMETHQLSVGRR